MLAMIAFVSMAGIEAATWEVGKDIDIRDEFGVPQGTPADYHRILRSIIVDDFK